MYLGGIQEFNIEVKDRVNAPGIFSPCRHSVTCQGRNSTTQYLESQLSKISRCVSITKPNKFAKSEDIIDASTRESVNAHKYTI